MSRFLNRRLEAERRIVEVLDGQNWMYGLDIMRRAHLRSGRFYPAIDRLEHYGRVEASWDDIEGPYPRRRMYRLTKSES